MKKTAKKAAKRPLVRKVEAAHRLREGKQKKTRIPPHVEDETPLNKGCDALPHNAGPDIVMEHDAQQGWSGYTEPSRLETLERCVHGMREDLMRIGRSVVPQEYRDAYGPEGNCGDLVALILAFRSQDEIEMFVYEKTGRAWPGVNAGMRRMNAGNVIRGLVNRDDLETMAWLLRTQPR